MSDPTRLKARAVRLLSRREHTRQELMRKLSAHAPDEESLVRVLDELAQQGWQSDERFVASFERHSQERYGARRIAHTMRERGVDQELIQESIERLKQTELGRAQDVWSKRFGVTGLPQDRKEYARQGRFLAARGFDMDTVTRVLSGRVPTAQDPFEE